MVTIVETLNCNSCGAPLEVPESANFLKCNHCGQQLAVRRSETATFTEVVDRLADTADALTEKVEELSRQNKIAQLDRRWEQQREDYMISDEHGHRHLPHKSSSLIGGIFLGVFGGVWTAMAIGITAGAPSFGPFKIAKVIFPAFGVLFVIFGVSMSIRSYQKAKDYRSARRQYEVERTRIVGGGT